MFFNNRGFNVVGILIGTSIMGVVIVGMMDAINMAMRGQRTIDVRLATTEFESQIYNFLSAQNICTYNFGNAAAVPINVSEFSGASVKTIAKLRTQVSGAEVFPYTTETTDNKNLYEQGRLRLVSMELRDFQPSGTAGADSLEALAKLRLNVERMGSFLGTKEVVRDISLKLQLSALYPVNPNPTIDFCVAVGGLGDQIWTQKPNKDIFYTGGKVGIGTNDPKATLQIDSVNDTASISSGLTGSRVSIGTWVNTATVAGWEPTTGTHNDLSLRAWPGTQLYLKNNGNVGIGVTDPASLFHVHGKQTISSGVADLSGSLHFDMDANKNGGYIISNAEGPFTKQLNIVLGNNNAASDPKYAVNDQSRIAIVVNGDGGTAKAGTITLKSKIIAFDADEAGEAKPLIVRVRARYPFASAPGVCPAAPANWNQHNQCTAVFDRKCGDNGYVGGVMIDWDALAVEGFCFRKGAAYANEILW